MAGGTNILKEFVIKLGFKIDQAQQRNFVEAMRNVTKMSAEIAKGFVRVAEASTLATVGLGASLKAAAGPLESLYFAAQRTGASAKELQEFSFAASQVGVSAEQAQAAIEGLAAARRTNPGLNGILAAMGIDPRQTDSAKAMVELLGKLRAMPHYQATQIANLFGLDERTLQQLEANGPQFLAAMKQREAMFARAGLDPDKFDARGREFMMRLRTLEAGLLDFSEVLATRLMPVGEKVIGWITDAAAGFVKLDKATDGWSSKILGLMVGLRAFTAAFSIIGKISGVSGLISGIAGMGGAAVGEGAAVAGGTALSGLALPVIIIAAVGAALVWLFTHQDLVRKAAGTAWEWTKKETGSAIDAAKTLNQQAKDSGGWINALSGVPGIVGNLASMVAGFEGHVKNGYGVYRDIAGKLTAGFGHLVRPGEDLSNLDKQGALALLGQDLRAAVASVAKLVKVHLSRNEADALADFVFNVGEAKFAKSTLLKKLNSGDFAGAADQFQYWNKALNNGYLVVNRGLSERRAAEAQLFRTPDKVQISQETNIHVTGGDAKGTADEVRRQQGRVNGDMVRNFATAVK